MEVPHEIHVPASAVLDNSHYVSETLVSTNAPTVQPIFALGNRLLTSNSLIQPLTPSTRGRLVTRYLVRWQGHTSADDEWLRLEELTRCPEKVAEYDAVAPRRRQANRREVAGPSAAPPAVPEPAPLVAPIGFRLAAPAEVLTGSALVGRTVMFRWPTEGWVRGTVVRRSRAAGFSHVVRYGPRSALGAAIVASLLDAASHGPAGRWALLFPARPQLSL